MTDWFIVGVRLLIVLAVLFVGAVAVGVDAPRGESTYTGVVVDVEVEKGIPATTQAHLKTDPQASSSESFCVLPDNDEHLETLRTAARNGSRVTVTYERPLFVPFWTCERGLSYITEMN